MRGGGVAVHALRQEFGMNPVTVRKESSPRHGRYVAAIEGIEGEAELRFTVRGPQLISADHTEAPASMKGTGAALAPVGHMIADARQNGFRIVPLCPYVKAQYRKHPEWNDVMKQADGGETAAP